MPSEPEPSARVGRVSTRWTKDTAGAFAAACAVAFFMGSAVREYLLNHHSGYPFTISGIVGVGSGLLGYWVMLRVMRRLP